MNGDPNHVEEATRAALPLDGRRDAWLEQRLGYLAASWPDWKGGPPLRRFLRGATIAYRRFLLTADPAHRFQCGVILQAVSAGLDQLERGGAGHEVRESAPDGPDPGQPLAGWTDRVP
jgi:hypothetical protein